MAMAAELPVATASESAMPPGCHVDAAALEEALPGKLNGPVVTRARAAKVGADASMAARGDHVAAMGRVLVTLLPASLPNSGKFGGCPGLGDLIGGASRLMGDAARLTGVLGSVVASASGNEAKLSAPLVMRSWGDVVPDSGKLVAAALPTFLATPASGVVISLLGTRP